MNKNLISIIIGAVLVVGMGTFVYTTKKPIVLPSEDGINNESGVNDIKTLPVVNNSWSDDDDDHEGEEEEGGVVNSPVVPTPKTTTPTPQPTAGGITLATIAKHNSKTSCWSAVNGSVYDLTSWIPNHPGGEQTILSMCGIDGSSGYNGQHGSSSKPARVLGGFKLGILIK
jgi:cytochrome b involved in lipid metabolism